MKKDTLLRFSPIVKGGQDGDRRTFAGGQVTDSLELVQARGELCPKCLRIVAHVLVPLEPARA